MRSINGTTRRANTVRHSAGKEATSLQQGQNVTAYFNADSVLSPRCAKRVDNLL